MTTFQIETLTGFIRDLDDETILKIINEYLESKNEEKICPMEDFDDFCETFSLSAWEIAEAVHDGDFHTWHNYFRYDGGEFTSGDDIDDVYDYTDDESFAEWMCGGDFNLWSYGISNDALLDEYCDYYGIDKEKLTNHPNWDEDYIMSDWDEILDDLDIEESEVTKEEE